MWPSQELASRLYNLANLVLIAGLVLGIVSTVLVVWMGNVKEAYAQAEGARLNESTALAHERTAKLEKEAGFLRLQLIEQGPRSHLLYGDRREKLIYQWKQFARQAIEIRYCRTSFNLSFIDNDVMSVVMLLEDALKKADWAVMPIAVDSCSGTGLAVSVHSKSSGETRRAADVILLSLEEVPLVVIGRKALSSDEPRPPQLPTFTAEGKEIKRPPIGVNTIVLTVLAHP